MSDLHLSWKGFISTGSLDFQACTIYESQTLYVSASTEEELLTELSSATVALTASSDVSWDFVMHRSVGAPLF